MIFCSTKRRSTTFRSPSERPDAGHQGKWGEQGMPCDTNVRSEGKQLTGVVYSDAKSERVLEGLVADGRE